MSREREDGEGFLTRWSRRKREEEIKPALPDAAPKAEADAVAPEPEFDISTLPSLESLTASSDVAAFMQKGVPQALQNAALRTIWSADTSIRDYIGPVEMDWDFNNPESIPGFGPLYKGTDVSALLKQAIGEPETEAEALAVLEKNAPELSVADAARSDDSVPQIDHSEMVAAENKTVSDGDSEKTTPSLAQSEEISAQGPKKRHGGALPAS